MSIEYTCTKIREYLTQNQYDGMLLGRRSSFAWFSGGESSMNFYTDMGLGFIWVTKDNAFVFCGNNEHDRISHEIFKDKFPVQSFSWIEGPAPNLQNLIANKKVVSDFGLVNTTEDFGNIKKLRYQLSPDQIKIATELSKRSSELLEKSLKNLKVGMSELSIQAEIRYTFEKEGISLPVLLIAGDENLNSYRHPLATTTIIQERIMAVICAQYKGVMIAASRIRYFREENSQEKLYNQRVAKINAEMIATSILGIHSSSLWESLLQSYKNHKVEDEYLNHHQGGAIGFESREWILRPNLDETLLENQLIAWNPTLRGTKSEETVIINGDNPKVLTISGDFPILTHKGITVTLPLI
ncbi:MAG: M24 family metallopeptidase [Brevinema sp.]